MAISFQSKTGMMQQASGMQEWQERFLCFPDARRLVPDACFD